MRKLILAGALGIGAVLTLPESSAAQSAPSNAEVAAYRGLHAAVARGDAAETARLIDGGADVNARDDFGRSALHVAVHAANRPLIDLLLTRGADPNAMDRQRYDTITIAAVAGHADIVATLIKGGGNPKAMTSPYDGTALIASSHRGHVEVVRTLIAAGAPLDHINNLGWTAVIEAIVLGDGGDRHSAILKMLIDAGANLQIADRQGRTPLALAKAHGFPRMVQMLDAAGAK